MIVDFDNEPRNSIIYTAGIILEYLKHKKGLNDFETLFKYCMEREMEYSAFFLSIDWLFLIGVIREINGRNELILCD